MRNRFICFIALCLLYSICAFAEEICTDYSPEAMVVKSENCSAITCVYSSKCSSRVSTVSCPAIGNSCPSLLECQAKPQYESKSICKNRAQYAYTADDIVKLIKERKLQDKISANKKISQIRAVSESNDRLASIMSDLLKRSNQLLDAPVNKEASVDQVMSALHDRREKIALLQHDAEILLTRIEPESQRLSAIVQGDQKLALKLNDSLSRTREAASLLSKQLADNSKKVDAEIWKYNKLIVSKMSKEFQVELEAIHDEREFTEDINAMSELFQSVERGVIEKKIAFDNAKSIDEKHKLRLEIDNIVKGAKIYNSKLPEMFDSRLTRERIGRYDSLVNESKRHLDNIDEIQKDIYSSIGSKRANSLPATMPHSWFDEDLKRSYLGEDLGVDVQPDNPNPTPSGLEILEDAEHKIETYMGDGCHSDGVLAGYNAKGQPLFNFDLGSLQLSDQFMLEANTLYGSLDEGLDSVHNSINEFTRNFRDSMKKYGFTYPDLEKELENIDKERDANIARVLAENGILATSASTLDSIVNQLKEAAPSLAKDAVLMIAEEIFDKVQLMGPVGLAVGSGGKLAVVGYQMYEEYVESGSISMSSAISSIVTILPSGSKILAINNFSKKYKKLGYTADKFKEIENKISHVFSKPGSLHQHNLEGFLKKFGGDKYAAYDDLMEGARKAMIQNGTPLGVDDFYEQMVDGKKMIVRFFVKEDGSVIVNSAFVGK